jgi:hypothetical protein
MMLQFVNIFSANKVARHIMFCSPATWYVFNRITETFQVTRAASSSLKSRMLASTGTQRYSD